MRTLEPKKLVVYQCSRKGLCLHGAEMLLGPPVDISQSSILKPQSFVLWISFAGDTCVLSGSDVSFLFSDNGACDLLWASGHFYSPPGTQSQLALAGVLGGCLI